MMPEGSLSMYLFTVFGFVLLFGGGELLVRGAVAVSRRFALSPLLVGMTVVAWCTSAPELVVSVGAALQGQSDIAVGNVIGSNIFNVLGVLGVAALITPIVVDSRAVRRDLAWMVGASLALALVVRLGQIGVVWGAVLLASMIVYVWYSYRIEKKSVSDPSAQMHVHEAEEFRVPSSIWTGVGYLGAGLAALILGSRLLIVGSTGIATALGIPEAIIGLSLVAVGTSLPELATSVVAALRRHPDVAVGNVVGSNIFNILGILGITAVVKPIPVATQMMNVDVWVATAVALVLVPLLLMRGRINRVVGLAFLVVYVSYLVVLFVVPMGGI